MFTLDAYPVVEEAYIPVSIMQVNGVCSFAMTGFCIDCYRM